MSLKRFMKITAVFAILLIIPLVGCQRGGLFIANIANNESLYTSHQNLAYGPEDWQQLDVYTPKDLSKAAPVIVFYYGGGWRGGSRADYQFVADKFVRQGYVTVVPDYRKFPPHTYPSFQEDAAQVTRWLVNNIDSYGGASSNMHLVGHSAGAHIGTMLLVNDSFLADVSLKPTQYQSFVGISGPYNFEPNRGYWAAIFGPPETFPNMQANTFVNGDEPPMLLMHGGLDVIVAKENMTSFETRIREVGGSVETNFYQYADHYGIVGSLSPLLGQDQTIFQDITAFIEKHANETD